MKLVILTIVLILSLTEEHDNTPTGCRQTWTYSKLDKDVIGTIVFYNQQPAICGYLSAASIALVKTDNFNTIRVLTLCGNHDKNGEEISFFPGDTVKVTPDKRPRFTVDLVAVDPKECIITDTFFGTVESK